MEQNSLPNTLAGIVVGIVLAAGGAVAGLTYFGHSYALPESVSTLRAAVQQARARAATTGNGATLAFARDATTHAYAATLYDGRPNGGAFDGPTGLTPFNRAVAIKVNAEATAALFISSSGTVSTDAWTNGTTFATEPACPGGPDGTFNITIGADGKTDTLTMSCGDASL